MAARRCADRVRLRLGRLSNAVFLRPPATRVLTSRTSILIVLLLRFILLLYLIVAACQQVFQYFLIFLYQYSAYQATPKRQPKLVRNLRTAYSHKLYVRKNVYTSRSHKRHNIQFGFDQTCFDYT
jgi:hypothetical protein